MAESESDIRITTVTREGDIWGVYCEDLGENLPHYNGTALYIVAESPRGSFISTS